MNRQLNLLKVKFHEPDNANIHWRQITSLLHHLGAAIESTHGARFRVLLNDVEFILLQAMNVQSMTSSNCERTWFKQVISQSMKQIPLISHAVLSSH